MLEYDVRKTLDSITTLWGKMEPYTKTLSLDTNYKKDFMELFDDVFSNSISHYDEQFTIKLNDIQHIYRLQRGNLLNDYGEGDGAGSWPISAASHDGGKLILLIRRYKILKKAFFCLLLCVGLFIGQCASVFAQVYETEKPKPSFISYAVQDDIPLPIQFRTGILTKLLLASSEGNVSELSATPTTSPIFVNNREIFFEAYNINGNNFFKLRDLAYVLNGTNKSFSVGWNSETGVVTLTSEKPYTPVGGEMENRPSSEKKAAPSTSQIVIDGISKNFIVFNIGGNNYFKLRDIGSAFNFEVNWDSVVNAVIIDTNKIYIENKTVTTANQASSTNQPYEAQKTDFVNLAEYIPSLIIDLPYASNDNFTHTKLYEQNIAYLRKGTADKLRAVVEEINQDGYNVKIWDAYRPPEVQFKMWSIVPDANYVANPWTGYSSHSRGSAVDITIDSLPMPTGYDDFTDKASRINQNDNARYLEAVMVKHGFVPLASEWWHYVDSEIYEPAEEITLAPLQAIQLSQSSEITISIIGDVILGQDFRFGNFNEYYRKNGPEYFFSDVKKILVNDTLTIANLEVALTGRTEIIDKSFQGDRAFWFKGDPRYTAILIAGGVEAVNLANNHSMDYLQDGYDDTITYLEKAGITSFGYDRIATINNVGLIGANVLGPIEEGVDIPEFKRNLIKQINTLKQVVPLVIVYFHWGVEYNPVEESLQTELAHLAIDEGADLVIGSHPHVLQSIERYRGKTIVYSLGNFVFGGNTKVRAYETAIFQQTFRFVNEKLVSADEGRVIPCYVSGNDSYNNYRPVLKKISQANK